MNETSSAGAKISALFVTGFGALTLQQWIALFGTFCYLASLAHDIWHKRQMRLIDADHKRKMRELMDQNNHEQKR
ncbi:hypothetical protein [Ferrimonas pelagia]|uniref:Holin n=1 Tax=Ferrimonas pelagia TaxID=1177826 RepID=A0ABP9EIJ2_9GAMM